MRNWQWGKNRSGGGTPVDLVLFLHGYEPGGTAVEAPVEAFRQSWRRPKGHVLVQDVPEEAGARRGL